MKRIVQLDFFRGLFLVVITVNHFISQNNIVYRFTHELIGWVTAAEGFIFLSGFTTGIVYSNIYQAKGTTRLHKQAYKRSQALYLYHILVSFIVVICLTKADYFVEYWQPRLPMLFPSSASTFSLIPLLLFLPPLLDILPLYLLYFLFVPVSIRSLFSRYRKIFIWISITIYFLGFSVFASFFNDADLKVNHMPYILNPLCWQFLFFIGLYGGYLFRYGRLNNIGSKNLAFVAAFLSLLLFMTKNLKMSFSLNIAFWTNKENLAPIRLLNFFSLTICMAFIASKFKRWFTYEPLCYLGRHSLEVFCMHILLVYLLRPIKEPLNSLYTIDIHATYKIYPYEILMSIIIILTLFLVPVLVSSAKGKKITLHGATAQHLNVQD